MSLDDAIRTRINELVTQLDTSLTNLCLNSTITPSTIFDFMYGRSKHPTVLTIKKLCFGAGISISEFFNRPYFNDTDDLV